jgi:hypothetical protein
MRVFPGEDDMPRCRVPVRLQVLVGVGVALTAAVGCGSGTVPVRGVITVDDNPVANASVQFISQEPGGRDAHATTNANGEFVLRTYQPGDGALPGVYKVVVRVFSEQPDVAPSGNAEEVQKAMVRAGAAKPPAIKLPEIYTQPDQTVLKHRVPDDGDAILKLRSAPP